MKFRLITTMLSLIALCTSSALFAQYDDLYYNPKTDYDYYYGTNVATKESPSENNSSLKKPQSGDNDYAYEDENYDEEDEYYYSKRIRRYNNNYRRFGHSFWDTPWYDSYWYSPASNVYITYGNQWNNRCDPWGYNRWNSYNNWNSWNGGFGNDIYVNNYYGYGNGWNSYGYGNGWNNYYGNNGWNNNGWNSGNSGGGSTSNPKGSYYGPRTHGGVSNPAPPIKVGRGETTEVNGTTGGRRKDYSEDTKPGIKDEVEEAAPSRNSWKSNSSRTPSVTEQEAKPNIETERPSRNTYQPQSRDNRGQRANTTPSSSGRDNSTRETSATTRDNEESKPSRSYSPPSRSSETRSEGRAESRTETRSETRSEPRRTESSRSEAAPSRSSSSESRSSNNNSSNNNSSGKSSSGGRGRN